MPANPLPDDHIPPALIVDEEPFELDALDDVTDPDTEWRTQDQADAADEVRRWEIVTDDDAEWAMAHVAAIDENIALLHEQHTARVARLVRHLDSSVARLARRRGFFTGHLIEHARTYRAKDPKRNKTLRLTNGEVRSSEPKPAAVIADDEAVAAWLAGVLATDEYDEAVNVTTNVYVNPFRKLVDLVERPVRQVLHLGCGHEVITDMDVLYDRGDVVACLECGDEIGAGRAPVADVEVVTELVVVQADDTDGDPVPGAAVEVKPITFTVKPS